MRYLLLLLLVSCAPHDQQVIIDHTLRPYLDRFIEDGARQNVQIKIQDLILQFGKIDDPYTLGTCYTESNSTPLVTINPLFWDSFEDKMKELIVYHELGHCVLFLAHDTSEWQAPDKAVVPASVMNPYLGFVKYYVAYRDHYMVDLFRVR